MNEFESVTCYPADIARMLEEYKRKGYELLSSCSYERDRVVLILRMNRKLAK